MELILLMLKFTLTKTQSLKIWQSIWHFLHDHLSLVFLRSGVFYSQDSGLSFKLLFDTWRTEGGRNTPNCHVKTAFLATFHILYMLLNLYLLWLQNRNEWNLWKSPFLLHIWRREMSTMLVFWSMLEKITSKHFDFKRNLLKYRKMT